MTVVHVIGAGLAGLSAAAALAEKGARVELHEAAPQAGGRCRSYFDPTLDQTIDNGNHLILSGNDAVFEYLRRIGSERCLIGPDSARFDFVELPTGERWTITPNEGAAPWWTFVEDRRVPGTRFADYLGLLGLVWPRRSATIIETVKARGALWDRLLRPFLLAALNTEPEAASAQLAAAVIRKTLLRGGRAYHPRIAHPTLASAFVEPALAFLESKGAAIRFGRRLKRIVFSGRIATALEFPETTIPLSVTDTVVLAVPSWSAEELLSPIKAPDAFRAIVNAHFKTPPPKDAPLMLGVIGGTVEWIFCFPDRISVTVSAADRLIDMDRDSLARLLWRDVAAALGLSDGPPPWQIVKEKRATFAATPEQAGRRPGARGPWMNLFLAGDWTDTGLPSTIEGAVRSGHRAARLALQRLAL